MIGMTLIRHVLATLGWVLFLYSIVLLSDPDYTLHNGANASDVVSTGVGAFIISLPTIILLTPW